MFNLLLNPGQYENIKVERRGAKKNVVLIQLNRPKTFNALCGPLVADITAAIGEAEADKDVGTIVITGSDKAFAGLFRLRRLFFCPQRDIYHNYSRNLYFIQIYLFLL